MAFRTDQATGQSVDMVAFGVYRREAFARIGNFDEALGRNQDEVEVNLQPVVPIPLIANSKFRAVICQIPVEGRPL